MGSALILAQDLFRESREQLRYQAREGFTVIEKGQQVRIERTAQEPLVLTMPKMGELDAMQRFRYGLDASVVWLFFFLAWSAFYLANQAQADALRCPTQARRRRKRGAGRAGPGAALPGQPALPVQHAEQPVVAGHDGARPTAPRRCCWRFRPSSAPACRSTPARTSPWPRKSIFSASISISKRRAFPIACRLRSRCPKAFEQARLPALLLQPLIENAIKYGVSKSRKTVLIRIEAKPAQDGRMLLEISNRLKHGGKEELPAATHEGTGLGLANVCQRLEARFHGRATCRFGPMTGGGYKVAITMPVVVDD